MSTIAFSSHGVEFEIKLSVFGEGYFWRYFKPVCGLPVESEYFSNAEEAKADAIRHATRITTGTVPGNGEE